MSNFNTPFCRIALAAFLLVGLWTGLPSPTAAQTGSASAEDLEDLSDDEKENFIEFIKAGKDAYSNGDFEKAIPFFERAYEILPNPGLQYRIALCHERSDQPAQALEHYKKFLELKPDTEKRGAVESTIEKLEKKVAEASVARVAIKSAPTDAQVDIRRASDDESEAEPRGRTPLDLELEPGEFTITLDKDGYKSTEETVELNPGESYNFSYTLDDVPNETDTGGDTEPRADVSSGTSFPTVAMLVGGVGALVGGTFYGVGLHCNGDRSKCSRGMYNASAISAYTGGAVALGGLSVATFQLLNGSGGQTEAAGADADTGIDVQVRFTGSGLTLTGSF